MQNRLKFLLGQLVSLTYRYSSVCCFLLVLVSIIVADIVFHSVYLDWISWLNVKFGLDIKAHESVELGFAPEVWSGVLALVLSTLIIVIAIAAENTPKLIDLYMKDWPSLVYIWFLILASMHALLCMFYANIIGRHSSVMLNAYGFLFLASFFVFPYVFYILLYSKTDNVVKNISRLNHKYIRWICMRLVYFAMDSQKVVESYQAALMGTIDQFDDLMQYTPFKEAKSEILSHMGNTIRFYIRSKNDINPKFFHVTPTVRRNPAFRTYIPSQYQKLEEQQIFYEIKALRMLGNAYTHLMESNDYELASLLTSEVVEVERLALELKQDELVKEIIIRFNTFFRFAIKHAIRNNDPRNLYNLSFYYGNLLIAFVDYDEVALVKQGYFYFRWYRNEIYRHAASNSTLHFIGDALTAELKRVSILVSEKGWDESEQEVLLSEILLLDNPTDSTHSDSSFFERDGVRMLQIGLALHYLKSGQNRLAEEIVVDVLSDLELYDEPTFVRILDKMLHQLRHSQPTFWEDTDRGNTNIYYSPDTDYIDTFNAMIDQHLKARLKA